MNEHDDRQDDDTGRQVSAAYRALSNERTPPALDRAILQQAAGAVDKPGVRPSAWLRPLAFAATLVLGVALLFEMQSTLQPPASPEELPESLPPVSDDRSLPRPASLPDANGNASRGANDASPTASVTSDIAETMQADEEKGEASESRQRPESTPQTARETLQELSSPASEGARRLRKLQPAAYADRSAAAAIPESENACGPDDTATADAWWLCIEALRDAGETHTADAELQRLQAAFPEFRGKR